MLNFHLHRCLRRTRPSARTSFRRAARPRLEILEAREVPATTMTRTPYSPYAQPAVVASLPQVEEPQQLTYSIDNTAAGNSVTAWVHVPSTGEPIPGVGVKFTRMTHLGVTSPPVLVEGFDFDPFDDHFTRGITGDVHVSCRPDGGFAITYVRSTAYFPDPLEPADSTLQEMVVRIFDANGTELPGPGSIASVPDYDPYDNIHSAIVTPKVGMDNLWGFTGAWRVVTTIDPADPEPGSTSVKLYERRWYDDITGPPYLTPTQLVAESFLDQGNGSFSEYDGDFILSHDLDTNASGKSVVVWDLHHTTETHPYSAYLTLDKIHRLRIDEYGTILDDANPDYEIVSQDADTWEAFPTPKVTINDLGQFAIAWAYAPDYNIPQSQLTALRGVYTRFYDWNAPITNEIHVVSSPNSDGRPSYPTPPQFYVAHTNHPIAINNAGDVVVGYSDYSAQASVTPHRLRGQLFNVNGTRIGDRFSFVESYWAYAHPGVGPEEFDFAMDENAHVSAAWSNPDPVEGTWATVIAQRFVRVDFDVQRGEIQRDTVRFVDFAFNPGMVDVAALTNPGRVQLIQYPLNGSQQGTPISLSGVLSYAGNTLTMDFGSMGLANGYYKALLDLDGDGVYEMVRTFYRMAGDFSGTGLNNNPWIHFFLND